MLSQACSCNDVSQISCKLLRLGKHVPVIDITYSWRRWKAVLWGRNQLCFHSNSGFKSFYLLSLWNSKSDCQLCIVLPAFIFQKTVRPNTLKISEGFALKPHEIQEICLSVVSFLMSLYAFLDLLFSFVSFECFFGKYKWPVCCKEGGAQIRSQLSDKHETEVHHKTHNKLTLLISSNIIKHTEGFCFVVSLAQVNWRRWLQDCTCNEMMMLSHTSSRFEDTECWSRTSLD